MVLKGFFKLDNVKNDNNIFRCHYKLTVLFLVTFTTLISLKQYVGDPIDCFVEGNSQLTQKDNNALDNYCWIHSTFTLPNNTGVKHNGQMGVPGMGTPKEGEPIMYHKYYQVSFRHFFSNSNGIMTLTIWPIVVLAVGWLLPNVPGALLLHSSSNVEDVGSGQTSIPVRGSQILPDSIHRGGE